MAPTAEPLSSGFLLLPKLTHFDLTGSHGVLARVPSARVHLIWRTLGPVASDGGPCPG